MDYVAMLVEEKHGGRTNDEILFKSKTSDKDVQSTLKVRKPYTITKQRERWADEEHTKFLDALKLHGRAWKKIEEHVGTKTAVQIRSHAQKFFSKIARESEDGDTTDAKPIEIPPPRPKRKPMHPYPRKLLAKTGISMPEKLTRSVSQNSSICEQENQSPVSVLSANSLDTFVQADSCPPNDSLSPVSSALAPNDGSEAPKTSIPDDSISQLGNGDENPNPVPLKLQLFCRNDDLVQEDQSSVQCLKLFGKTLLVKDCFQTSEETCKHDCLDKTEENCLFPRRVVKGPVLLSWLTLSSHQVHNPETYEKKENVDKNEENEASSSGSTSNEEKPCSLLKLSKKSSASSEDCRKGFAPYKRRISERRDCSYVEDTDFSKV